MSTPALTLPNAQRPVTFIGLPENSSGIIAARGLSRVISCSSVRLRDATRSTTLRYRLCAEGVVVEPAVSAYTKPVTLIRAVSLDDL